MTIVIVLLIVVLVPVGAWLSAYLWFNTNEVVSKMSRNDIRKADLNHVAAILEKYKSDHRNYPEKSECLENISDLEDYFQDKSFPQDPNGLQEFETVQKNGECMNGYYYLNMGSRYILWAKMENNEGNSDYGPYVIESEVNSPYYLDYLKQTTSGRYYMVAKLS